MNMQLMFELDHSTELKDYTNFGYIGNVDIWKSSSNYVFTHACKAISWRLKLQECSTLSMTKAEYIATSETTK